MNPADFDVDQRIIPHASSSSDVMAMTPKKKPRKDPEDLTPETDWKPSVQSSRSSKIQEEMTTMSKLVKSRLSTCTMETFKSLASRWLYRALQVGVQQVCPDYRVVIQMGLEAAPIDDMDIAFTDVFGLAPIIDPNPRCRNKDRHLHACINRVFDCAKLFED